MKGGIVNIVTPLAFLTGATAKLNQFGTIDVTYQGKTREFSKELIAQLPNKSVQAFIEQSFDTPD